MPTIQANGVDLFYELTGTGDPMVLVHGSWVDQSSWATVVRALADSFQVLAYDRRGHSRSQRPDSQGSVHEDAADLGALLDALFQLLSGDAGKADTLEQNQRSLESVGARIAEGDARAGLASSSRRSPSGSGPGRTSCRPRPAR